MKKSLKSGIAVVLALAFVVSVGIYSKDSKLKASDENVYEEQPAEVTPATEVQEIIIDIPAAPAEEPAPVAEETEEPAAAEEEAEAPADENDGVVKEIEAPAEPAEAAEEAENTAEEPEAPVEESAEAEEAEDAAEEAEETEDGAEEAGDEESEEDEDEEEPELRVWITTSLDGVDSVESGTVIVLTAHLEGFEGIEYTVQWQKSLNGIDWADEQGATELVYRFALTEANDDYIWRIMIFTED